MPSTPQPHQGFVEIFGADPELKNNFCRKSFGIINTKQMARNGMLCLKYGWESPIESKARGTQFAFLILEVENLKRANNKSTFPTLVFFCTRVFSKSS